MRVPSVGDAVVYFPVGLPEADRLNNKHDATITLVHSASSVDIKLDTGAWAEKIQLLQDGDFPNGGHCCFPDQVQVAGKFADRPKPHVAYDENGEPTSGATIG